MVIEKLPIIVQGVAPAYVLIHVLAIAKGNAKEDAKVTVLQTVLNNVGQDVDKLVKEDVIKHALPIAFLNAKTNVLHHAEGHVISVVKVPAVKGAVAAVVIRVVAVVALTVAGHVKGHAAMVVLVVA